MTLQTSVLESSIRTSLDRSLEDLRSILGFDSESVLEVRDLEVVGRLDLLSKADRLYDLMTNIWVDFSGDTRGRLILAQSGESAGRLLKELEEHCVGFKNAEAAWNDILGEIGNVILNGVIKGFVRDFELKLEAAIPEVRDTALYQVCSEALGFLPGSDMLIVDASLKIQAIGFEAEVWAVLDPASFAG